MIRNSTLTITPVPPDSSRMAVPDPRFGTGTNMISVFAYHGDSSVELPSK